MGAVRTETSSSSTWHSRWACDCAWHEYTCLKLPQLCKGQVSTASSWAVPPSHTLVYCPRCLPQEDSRVVLVQKYADGGDLLKALHHAGGRLTEHSAVSMVIQPLLSCMVYLHSKNIIHRCARLLQLLPTTHS